MRVFLAAVLMLFLVSAHAKIYKCVDDGGKVTFDQVPCGGVLDEELPVEPAQGAPVAPVADRAVRVVYPAPQGSEADARAAISEKLKDPDSLQIRNIVATGISPDPEKWVICGDYNARNSFGGYVGFHKFAILDGKAFLGGNDIEAILVNATCN